MSSKTLQVRQLEPGTAVTQDEWPRASYSSPERLSEAHPSLVPAKWDEEIGGIAANPLRDVTLGSLFDDRLRLRNPLRVELEREGEFYIAKCEAFQEFGFGASPLEAVDDFRQTLAELYWALKRSTPRLGADLAATWERLNEQVEER